MTLAQQGLMLRSVRTVIGIVAWTLLTWGLVSWGTASDVPWLAGWLEEVQFLPAVMAFSMSTIVVWVLVTLIFGRVYCSTVCPLGAWQDLCARLPRLSRRGREHGHYHYSRPLTAWRNAALSTVVIAVFIGMSVVIVLLDPWQIYSLACVRILKPACQWIAVQMGDPALRIATASLAGTAVSVVLMGGIGLVAAKNGRTFCNTLCPVGTALGYVSRYSIFHIEIDTDRCTHCRRCEHACKASCIDLNDHVIDGSRCVDCFDCLTACHDDAISYTYRRHALSTPLMQRLSPTPTAQT